MKKYWPILVMGMVVGGVFLVFKGKKLPGMGGGKIDLDPEKDIKVIYNPEVEIEKPNAYLVVSYQGKEVQGPINIQLQQEEWEVKTLELLNNGRKQIRIDSYWGPYSSVAYFYDFDGKAVIPLCHLPFEKYAILDTSCQFMTNRGFAEVKDLDGDGIKEINVLHDADAHAQPSVYSLDFKWDESQGKYYLDEVVYDDGQGNSKKITESDLYIIGRPGD